MEFRLKSLTNKHVCGIVLIRNKKHKQFSLFMMNTKNQNSEENIILKVINNLKNRRFELGISQRELEERSGLCLNHVGLIERGEKTPTIKTLVKLADGLKFTIAEFFL
jgi:DNA-binding XRE family transcriptional regulator